MAHINVELEESKRILESTKVLMKGQIDKANDTLEEERQNSTKKSRQQDETYIAEREKNYRYVTWTYPTT